MNKLKNKIGMTMAELLMVVAIIIALCGVGFIAVYRYQRSLGQLERDGIAKEIFVAAQNHLTAAYGEGYLGLKEPENDSTEINPFGTMDSDGAYYFVVNGNIDESTVLGQMLPFGSIDETVRAGGSYIIRYQKETGMVLDVFYCTRNGSPSQFNYTFFEEGDDYDNVLKMAGPGNKDGRNDYRDGYILGWYGGAEAATLATLTLDPPTIKVTNADKLSVTVENNPNNSGKTGVLIKLIIEGLSSGAKIAYPMSDLPGTVVLDDVTETGKHFAQIEADSGKFFIPGENIKVYAMAYSTSALANIAYSASSTTNSLFASISDTETPTGTFETANISSIRHLENLDQRVSNLGKADKVAKKSLEKFEIKKAVQISDMNWETFKKNTSAGSNGIFYWNGQGSYKVNCTSQTGTNNYYPISPSYLREYDGDNHSISNIQSIPNSDADFSCTQTGLFGSFGSDSTTKRISNLELIDFYITSNTSAGASAGALAGILDGCTVNNVLARNKDNGFIEKKDNGSIEKKQITAPTAGGLIGITGSKATVEYSAAAMTVSGSVNAGGLIGNASGKITGCYSGGHTQKGSYNEWVSAKGYGYDVTGGNAGGLVGSSSAEVIGSYSTCSVFGTAAGGFAGTANSGSIANCYSTGLVDGTTKFAFLGGGSASLTNDRYFSAINEMKNNGVFELLLPASGYALDDDNLKPIDLDADTYNKFVGKESGWDSAQAFDPALVQYYKGKYTLKTVGELIELPSGSDNYFVKTHYGDWPAPEIFVINE